MRALTWTLVVLGVAACGPQQTDSLRIGGIFSTTGANAEAGFAQLSGARLAVEEINAHGGVNGVPLQLVVRDDGTDLNKTIRVAQALAGEQLPAFVGTSTSRLTRVALDSLGADTLLVSPAATAPELTADDPGNRIFRTCGTADFEGRLFAQRMMDRGIFRAAVLTSKRTLEQGLADAFAVYLAAGGGTVVARDALQPGEAAYLEQVNAAVAAGAEAIVLDVDTVTAAQVINSYATLSGARVRWYLSHNTFGQGLIEAVGARTFQGLEHEGLTLATPQGRRYQAFATAWRTRFQSEPPVGNFAPQAWDAVQLIALGLAGTDDTLAGRIIALSSGGAEVGLENWAEALRLIGEAHDVNFEGASSSVDLDVNGDTRAPYDVWSVVDGQISFTQRAVPAPL